MFFLILDKNPVEAAFSLPPKIRHKQLLEVMQMLSCVVDFGYDELPTGKAIKDWISRNKLWVHTFCRVLMADLNLSKVTRIKYKCLLDLLEESCKDLDEWYLTVPNIKTAVFRYAKEYEDTEYPTNTELPIDVAVKEYEKYLKWKEKHDISGKYKV